MKQERGGREHHQRGERRHRPRARVHRRAGHGAEAGSSMALACAMVWKREVEDPPDHADLRADSGSPVTISARMPAFDAPATAGRTGGSHHRRQRQRGAEHDEQAHLRRHAQVR